MTSTSIITDVRAAIELLAASDAAGAQRVAGALDQWLRGVPFEPALGLLSDWRLRLRLEARDRALEAIEALHPHLDTTSLARRIAAGVDRARQSATRPDGVEGLCWDLVQAGAEVGARQLRRLLTELRGHHGARMATQKAQRSKLLAEVG